MISLTNYDFQWARSELVIIYPDSWPTFRIPVPLQSKSLSLLPWCDSESPLQNNVSKLLLVRQIQQRTNKWFKRYTIRHMKPMHTNNWLKGKKVGHFLHRKHKWPANTWMMDGMNPNQSKYPLAILPGYRVETPLAKMCFHGFHIRPFCRLGSNTFHIHIVIMCFSYAMRAP